MRILVKSINGITTPLEVDGRDLVGKLRSKIRDGRQSDVRLVCAGRDLEDQYPLSYYSIHEESVVYAIEQCHDSMRIFVKPPSSETISLKVKDSDLTEAVRFSVCDAIGIPHTWEGRLVYRGMQLENGRTLSDYDIQNDSTLSLVACLVLSNKIQVTVRPRRKAGGKDISVEADPSMIVAELKMKIYSQEGTPAIQQQLTVSGKRLEDHRTLSDCKIESGFILMLEACRLIQVTVSLLTGERFVFYVEPFCAIKAIKDSIQQMYSVPLELQKLVYRGQILRGISTLADYGIGDGSTINLVRRIESVVSIFAEQDIGKISALEEQPSTTTESIKSTIKEKAGIPPEHQLSVMRGNIELENGHTLDYYNMTVGEEYTLSLVVQFQRPFAAGETVHPFSCSTSSRDIRHSRDHPVTEEWGRSLTAVQQEAQKSFTSEHDLIRSTVVPRTHNQPALPEYSAMRSSSLHRILDGMRVSVKYRNQHTSTQVKSSDSIEDLKSIIFQKLSVPPNRQKLFLGDKLLKDGHKLHDYDIQENNVILLEDEACEAIYSVRFYRNLEGSDSVAAVFAICLCDPLHTQHCDEMISSQFPITHKGEGITVENHVSIIGDEVELRSTKAQGLNVSFDKNPPKILKAAIDVGKGVSDLSKLPDYPPRLFVYKVKVNSGQDMDSCSPEVEVIGLGKQLAFAGLPVIESSLISRTSVILSSEFEQRVMPEVAKPPVKFDAATLSITQVDELIDQSGFDAIKSCSYQYEVYSSYTALMVASLRGLYDVARHILKKASEIGGEELKAILDQQDANGQSSLLLGSTKGHCIVVKLLLRGGAWIDQQDDEGQSALMLSSGAGHNDTTTLLLEKKAQVDLQDRKGYSALMHAVKNGQYDTAKQLLDNGADIDQQSRRFETALSIAFDTEWNKSLVCLLQERVSETPMKPMDADVTKSDEADEPVEWQQVKLPVSIATLTLFKYTDDGYCKNFRLVSMVDSKWMDLGHRVNLNQNQLDGMDRRHRQDPTRCWCQVMSDWMDREEVTWEKIYNELRNIRCAGVAQSLQRALFSANYQPPQLQSVRRAAPQTLPPANFDEKPVQQTIKEEQPQPVRPRETKEGTQTRQGERKAPAERASEGESKEDVEVQEQPQAKKESGFRCNIL